MNSVIIDTHTFLWFINDSPQLSINAKNLLESDVDIMLSVASLWEIAIKISINKLTIPDSYEKFIPQQLTLNEITILPISIEHLATVATLLSYHRDPFDRLLISQSIVEKLSIVSADAIFDSYLVNRIW